MSHDSANWVFRSFAALWKTNHCMISIGYECLIRGVWRSNKQELWILVEIRFEALLVLSLGKKKLYYPLPKYCGTTTVDFSLINDYNKYNCFFLLEFRIQLKITSKRLRRWFGLKSSLIRRIQSMVSAIHWIWPYIINFTFNT